MTEAARRPWIDALFLAAVFAALAASSWGAWPDVLVDFGRELYVAWRVRAGDVLYRDVASFYGPLSPYVNAAVFRLLGVSLRALVLANLALLAATTWLLRALLLRAGTARWVATSAAAAFLALFGFGHVIAHGSFNFVCPYSHEATHGFTLGLLALLCALRGARGTAWTAAAGALCGLTFLTKPEPFAAALGACGLVVASGGVERASRLRAAASFAAALAVPPLVAWGLLCLAMPADEAGLGVLGSWAYAGSSEVRGLGYFGWSAGVDRPLTYLAALARASGVQLAVLAPAAGLAWVLRRWPRAAPWVALAASAALAAFLASRWPSREWLALARPLPLWTLALLAASVVALWRARRGEQDPRARALARAALCVFALLLLPRILLNARFFHYGFVLSSVATLILIAALLDWIPRALERRGARALVFRAVALVAVAFVLAEAVRDSHRFMAAKKAVVGTGADAFRADARGPFVAAAVEGLGRVDPEGTLVALPEGVMINYLLRRRSSIPYLTMLPSDEAQFGEDELLGSLQRRPPDAVVLVHRTTHEFGLPLFGRDYAQRTLEWVYARYAVAFTVGDPPLQPDARFGLRALRRAAPVER
jgi:hypothetical protein